jgi:integrase
VLTDDELRGFWLGCDELSEPFGPLLKLLLLTGARLREVAEMTHAELNGGTWIVPPSRTKNKLAHTVPLPCMAQEIIADLARVAGEPGFLFSTNGRTPVSGFSKIKARLDGIMLKLARNEGADIPPWRIHDLRRTAATGMARAGVDLPVIERALNHVSGSFAGIVGVYQRYKFEDEVRAALEAWANLLCSIVEPREAKNLAALAAAAA